MATVPELYTINKDAVFKALFTAVFVCDQGAGEIPEELFDENTGELLPLGPGWFPVGYTSDAGTTHSRDRSIAETMSAQEASPVREDVESDTQTTQVVMLETSPVAIALYEGLPFSEFGELGEPLTWAKPRTPNILNRHWLFLGVDLSKKTGAERIRARLYPSGAVNEIGDQVESRAEVTGYEITVKAFLDPEYGTDVLNWMDGPGWRELAATNPSP